ncbi:MAG: hypothetical protein NT051_06720 [Candidatus Micrarchaeota archaeon]|nr:hypothetical protein [Candidatus Micrarchaeota archaeon]
MARKLVRIILVRDAQAEYGNLEQAVAEEKKKGIPSSFHQTLFRSIQAKFKILREHYDYGEQIPRSLIPKKYSVMGATNLWKVDLSGYWRMIYTLHQPAREGAEIEIMEIFLDVLDIVDHPTYDRIFGYRKK